MEGRLDASSAEEICEVAKTQTTYITDEINWGFKKSELAHRWHVRLSMWICFARNMTFLRIPPIDNKCHSISLGLILFIFSSPGKLPSFFHVSVNVPNSIPLSYRIFLCPASHLSREIIPLELLATASKVIGCSMLIANDQVTEDSRIGLNLARSTFSRL